MFDSNKRLMLHTMSPKINRIHDLPNEILEKIMGYLDGIHTLSALVEVDIQAKLLFEARPRLAILRASTDAGVALQLQKLACKIATARDPQVRDYNAHTLQTFFSSPIHNLENAPYDCVMSGYLGPLASLQAYAHVHSEIAKAEASFVKFQLPKTADRIPKALAWEELPMLPDWPPAGNFEQLPSPTELHRIRRAFWRLWLYFDVFHTPPGRAYKKRILAVTRQEAFFGELTDWEVEELDCAYYYLKYQTTALWRKPCPRCKAVMLPDELMTHNEQCGGTQVQENCGQKIVREPNYQYGRQWYGHYLFGKRRPWTCWSDTQEANRPNGGWMYLQNNARAFNIHKQYKGMVGCFLGWGYSIWDDCRLRRWHLLDEFGQAVHARWRDGVSRPDRCVHCCKDEPPAGVSH